MRVSIAMCTFNGERYLRRQLESFAWQTVAPFELVVCDDGSSDETVAVVQEFARGVAFAVRVFRNERNLGSTKNFEKAIGLCEGELIALADQDDEWYPEKLERVQAVFERFPRALAVFGDAEIMDDNSETVRGRRLWKSVNYAPGKQSAFLDESALAALLRLDYIATGATMAFRREFRDEFVPIPESWVHDAWISWIAALEGGLAGMPESTIRYRVHGSQQIGVNPASLRERVALVRKNVAMFQVIAKRLRALKYYMEQHSGDERLARFIPVLSEKIRHMEGRASMPQSALPRVLRVLGSWRDYCRFARGPVAMLADAFVVKRD